MKQNAVIESKSNKLQTIHIAELTDTFDSYMTRELDTE